jgi:hypothetical protein
MVKSMITFRQNSDVRNFFYGKEDHPHWEPLWQHFSNILMNTHDAAGYIHEFGGNLHILESFGDFLHVTFMGMDDNGVFRETNLALDPGSFDIARKIEDSDWYEFHFITTNAGGPVWFIPEELAKVNENVQESVNIS